VTSAAETKIGEARLGGVGAVVAAEIEKCTGKESRASVLGHLQRGGSPTPFDRALCSIFGATAVELVAAGEFGKMVAFTGPQIGSIKISDAVGKLKAVRPDGNFVRTARALGICFGD
jgi:6-phosphofructokinase 1